MNQRQPLGFAMRLHNGTYLIYLIRTGGTPIPVADQRSVFTSRNVTRAQTVCDALNNGLLSTVGRAVAASRKVSTP